MCGIFFSLHRSEYVLPDDRTKHLLDNRGPDRTRAEQRQVTPTCHAYFLSTVLSLRGTSVVEQPLCDPESGSVLCWNGEAWLIDHATVNENDSQAVFSDLLTACAGADGSGSTDRVVKILSSIRGPFAMVFFDASNKRVYFGRDCLGRRSLLKKSTVDGTIVLSSLCDNPAGDHWSEVEADGIYTIDLQMPAFPIKHIPQYSNGQTDSPGLAIRLPFPRLNGSVESRPGCPTQQHVQALETALRRSIELRVQHVREAIPRGDETAASNSAVAILFSGGLDCTLLARLAHNLLPVGQSIDLLNVAFENPRIHSNLESGITPFELCPDRITGLASQAELVRVCPDRIWHFVEINVPYTETVAHRGKVMSLMHPHNTEMDLSISYALYFASRGSGVVNGTPYSTPAHVLLSGLGADELFGGYQRHATAFTRKGYTGLIEELELDFSRLGKRNLGRDDRVISDSGKEARFPYLDEDFIALALELPVWAKCDFANVQATDSIEPSQRLEPAKRILRMLAWELGMESVAMEKKRAIQFGARTAKMETGRTKGTQLLT